MVALRVTRGHVTFSDGDIELKMSIMYVHVQIYLRSNSCIISCL